MHLAALHKPLDLSHNIANACTCCSQIVYYDGQFDDSRLCIALACTAALAGAAVTNHTEATRLLKVT